VAQQQGAICCFDIDLGGQGAKIVDRVLANHFAKMRITNVSNSVIEHPAIVVAAHAYHGMLFKKLDAELEITRAIAEVAGAQKCVSARLKQAVDRCFETVVFGVDVADQANFVGR